MNNEPILEIRNLSKVFRSDLLKGKQVALSQLDYCFDKGKCTGLLGHNGAGKTTTIRLILGLLRPDQGEILWQGKPMQTKHKARLGYMPEVAKLPRNLTPEEILHQQLRIMGMTSRLGGTGARLRVHAALERVGLFSHRHKRTHQLSKGMGRKLAWLQATIHEPELLILDEPFSGLDPIARHELESWVMDMKKADVSMILCTHELWTVRSLCDEFLILNHGRPVFSTKPLPQPDGRENLSPPVDLRAAHNLHLSGITEDELKILGQRLKLLPWQRLHTQGFVTVLGFAEYTDAMAWLKAVLASGVVVVRFGDESFLGEEELLGYFAVKKEQSPHDGPNQHHS